MSLHTSGSVNVSLCSFQVFIYVAVSSCFDLEVWWNSSVPVNFPACVNLFHLCLVVFPPSGLFKPRWPSCLGQEGLFFPEWFPVCYLFNSGDATRLLYLCCCCCVSWFSWFWLLLQWKVWCSLFRLCVHSVRLRSIALAQKHNLVVFLVSFPSFIWSYEQFYLTLFVYCLLQSRLAWGIL